MTMDIPMAKQKFEFETILIALILWHWWWWSGATKLGKSGENWKVL